MKYIRFEKEGTIRYGILEGTMIKELDQSYITGKAKETSVSYSLSEVTVLAPVNPAQVLCIGLNYELHAKEQGKPLPEEPMMFMVSPSAVIGDGDDFELAKPEHRIDYEAELAVVIGKEAKNLTRENALSHVFGYTCGNDVSDRDFQKKDKQYTRAKSFAGYKPLGPVIETELNPNDVEVKLTLNGKVRQQSRTTDLIHDVEEILVKATEVMTLQPGDVILTGTPEGVGPLSPGDRIEVEIEGIGKLTNTVRP
ncbi:FAA hydrolase family protein [Halobacillus fulvus]|nr:FAA hydrolase family protein [Halobacillus fulvus]